jgi:hypothetical protein
MDPVSLGLQLVKGGFIAAGFARNYTNERKKKKIEADKRKGEADKRAQDLRVLLKEGSVGDVSLQDEFLEVIIGGAVETICSRLEGDLSARADLMKNLKREVLDLELDDAGFKYLALREGDGATEKLVLEARNKFWENLQRKNLTFQEPDETSPSKEKTKATFERVKVLREMVYSLKNLYQLIHDGDTSFGWNGLVLVNEKDKAVSGVKKKILQAVAALQWVGEEAIVVKVAPRKNAKFEKAAAAGVTVAKVCRA